MRTAVCPRCAGTGLVFSHVQRFPWDKRGIRWDQPCPVCHGTGRQVADVGQGGAGRAVAPVQGDSR